VGSLAAIGQQVSVVVVPGEGSERGAWMAPRPVRAPRRLGRDPHGRHVLGGALSEAELVPDRLMRIGEGATALEQDGRLSELKVEFEWPRDPGLRVAGLASSCGWTG